MTLEIGLAIAALSALASNVAFLMRHRGANAAPDVDIRSPVRSVASLFAVKWWTIGFAVQIVAWLLHVTALRLAPLSLVQTVLAGGFIVLGIVAERFFGFKLGRREWIGITLTTLGLGLLGITAGQAETNGTHASYPIAAAIAFEGGLIALGAAAFVWHRRPRGGTHAGVLLGGAAGLLFTVSHVGIKALTREIDVGAPATLLNVWVPVVIGAFVVAFFASARSLQVGAAVPVIAITSVTSNVSAILAGIVVFRDPLGEDPLTIAIRVAAFALVVIAAALFPAPMRAAGQRPAEAGGEQGLAPARAPG